MRKTDKNHRWNKPVEFFHVVDRHMNRPWVSMPYAQHRAAPLLARRTAEAWEPYERYSGLVESTLHTEKWESRISRPCGLEASTLYSQGSECTLWESPCGLVASTPHGRRPSITGRKRSRGELAEITLRESWREHIRLLPRWTGHRGACQISLSLIYMRERERHTHILLLPR